MARAGVRRRTRLIRASRALAIGVISQPIVIPKHSSPGLNYLPSQSLQLRLELAASVGQTEVLTPFSPLCLGDIRGKISSIVGGAALLCTGTSVSRCVGLTAHMYSGMLTPELDMGPLQSPSLLLLLPVNLDTRSLPSCPTLGFPDVLLCSRRKERGVGHSCLCLRGPNSED